MQLMKKLSRLSSLLIVLVLWAGSALPLLAQTVLFSNTNNDLNARFDPGSTQVGNEVLLANNSKGLLTDFSFEFWGTNTLSPGNTAFAGPVAVEVRMFLNDGPLSSGVPSPGTRFFDSGPILLSSIGAAPTARGTILFSSLMGDFPLQGLTLPSSDITWTVQFTGLGATDSVGVDLYYPPTVGHTYGDYWSYNGLSWVLQTNSVVPLSSFGAYFAVPEPSSMSLALLGGLGVLALVRGLRRKD
jgi:hypothetical protein